MQSLKLRSFCGGALAVALVMGWSGSSSAASTIVSTRNSSDPHAIVFDGKLYLYTSMDLNQSGSWPMEETYCYTLNSTTADPSLASSWTDNGVVLKESAYGWSTKAKHLWAPDAFKGPDGKYYLYVPDVYDSASTSRVGVSVSTSPTGPFAPPSGLTNNTNYIPNGSTYMSDPNVFVDPSGQYYLVFADGGYDNCGHISIAKLDPTTSTVTNSQKVQWSNQSSMPKAGSCTPAYMEGPQLAYFGGAGFDGNGKYFLYFAMKDNTSITESIAYATADTPMGPYTYQGIIMSGQGGTGWTNQASIVEWQGHYLFFYHNDPKNQSNPNRQVFLSCVGIKNGKIDPPITRNTFTSLSACPTANTGATSSTGGTSSGGAGSGGTKSTGGSGSVSAGGKSGLGGAAVGGKSGLGGAAVGGKSGLGGAAVGGAAVGGAVATGGAGATTGGATSVTSALSTGGAIIGASSAPRAGASSIVPAGGNSASIPSGTAGSVPPDGTPSDGCSCRLTTTTQDPSSTRPLGLLALGMLAFARRRRR